MAETGAVSYMFERKGEIVFSTESCDADAIFEAAIDAGAEDIESFEDAHIVYTADSDLASVSSALETQVGNSETAKLVWLPTVEADIAESDEEKLIRLLDALEDDDDVQNVTTNQKSSRDVAAA